MADREIIDALADCLEALRRGETDVQRCLERYPAHRQELEALLGVVQRIPTLPLHVQPSAPFKARTRRLLADEDGPLGLHGEGRPDPHAT